MFEKYLEDRGINPEHYATAQNNPIAMKFAKGVRESQVDF